MELLLLFFSVLDYGKNVQSKYDHPIQKEQSHKQVDRREEDLRQFFDSFDSPLTPLSDEFVAVADRNGLDYRLLPVVACVESSCGKNFKLNAFGWGSDNIDFGNDSNDLSSIASKIKELSYYKTYRQSGELYDFALAYNRSYAQEYFEKLNWFWKRI
jgi:hypothetical protein